MDRGVSSSSAPRVRPRVIPVTSDGRGDGGSMLKSPADTLLTVSSTSSPLGHGPRAQYQELRFLVTGSKLCGKTTFIQKALDMKKPMTSPNQAKKMSLDGQIFMINLTEVPIEDIAPIKGSIKWPSRVGNIDITTVHGILALYDITKKESLTRIPSLLKSCSTSKMPCVLVSCKCDVPAKQRAFNPDEIEQKCMEETAIEGIQISSGSLESYRRCISVVLRNYIDDQARKAQVNGPRSRAIMANNSPTADLQSHQINHGRTISGLTASTTTISESSSRLDAIGNSSETVAQTTVIPEILARPISPADSESGQFSRTNRPKLELGNIDLQPRKPTMGTPTTIANSFIDFESSAIENDQTSSGKASPIPEQRNSDRGWTFDELVDRLLSQPISRVDHKFNAAFLCLYRKFAAPSELFAAVLQSFEKVEKNEQPYLIRLGSQLRHLAILEQWLGTYPGDFAHPFLRTLITSFVRKIGENRLFAAAAHEMSAHLDSIVEDDDTNWAASDLRRGRESVVKSMARVPSLSSSMSTLLSETNLISDAWHDTKGKEHARGGHSKTPSSASSMDKRTSTSASSATMLINSVESAQRQADVLSHSNRISLSKIQWLQFIDTPEEDHAKELTRIDRILYSAIRPRDLIRHVSMTTDQREQCRGLEYVTQMIDQFNHVAFWVTNMLLLRDKARHRALAMEKMMKIARKLRQANNYNGLGAVLAGIHSIPVHRLVQTRELVPGPVVKDFMTLEILMSSSKSHAAYRLAWENTTLERIPFLPLHRRDLVSAEDGNKTFSDDSEKRINWSKFEIMGDIIIGIQESQGTAFQQIHGNSELQRLILDTRLSKDEDDLYERSCYLEPPRANENSWRFNWFQR